MDENLTVSIPEKNDGVTRNKVVTSFLAAVVFVILFYIKGKGFHPDLYFSLISVVVIIWGYPLDGQKIKTIVSAYAIMWSLFALAMLSEGPKGIAFIFIVAIYLFLPAVITNYFLKILEK